jgi:hypothetical protein
VHYRSGGQGGSISTPITEEIYGSKLCVSVVCKVQAE